ADLDVIYDVEKFEKAASVAERLPVGDPRKLFALNEAINLYGGQFLNDVPSLWATERRRQLEIRYLDLISEQALEALARDQPRRAIESLRRGLSVDPLRDDLNIRYLEALGRLGQVSEVSAHYLHYTRLIREELGIDPPEAIRELYARLIS
ncbi:MAG TPA: bacterial transcriptional activator domain-containing protein, partial [Anaerolineales bacterium]|nr:bacterial transcriptional activator domain-containing protein [Anaerolineales bacterium]